MDRPSEEWKRYMQEYGSTTKASNASFDLYVNKYIKKKNDYDIKEKVEDKFFIPGKMYSFLYTTDSKPSIKRPFINRRPVVLSFGQKEQNGKIYEIGIDLMLIPFNVRISILDLLFKFCRNDINDNQNNIDDGRKGKKGLPLNYDTAKKMFIGTGWQMAFQAYDRSKVAKPFIYDYADWVTLIPLFTDSLEGMQMQKVYDRYIRNMKHPLDEATEMNNPNI